MEFLLKSSAVIAIIYICYKLLLQKETFFASNRWFLLSGLVASVVIPIISIPVYAEIVPIAIPEAFIQQDINTMQPPTESAFDWMTLIPWIYGIGLAIFLGKLALELISLFILIRKHPVKNDNSFRYIESETVPAPFSFFHWIFYNPKQFDNAELQLVMNHEKVHVRQFHTLDVICAQLACAILWFNPLIWMYKKALQQNLEFIADQEAQSIAICEKSYQNLLLKSSISHQELALANNFYNSLIKKRIVMLHKSKSNKLNAWKYSLVLPLLIAFVFHFNTEIIAQTPKNTSEEVTKIGQNILKFIISEDTKDTQLERIKKSLAEKDVSITFNNLNRNSKDQIIAISIDYESKISKGNHFVNSENPINPIEISLNVDEHNLSIGQASSKLSQSFEIIKEDGETKLQKSRGTNEEGDDILNIKESKESKTTKDSIYIRKDVKKIVLTNEEGNEIPINASENGNNVYRYTTQNGNQPLMIVDGKEISVEMVEPIDPNNIESVTVLRDRKQTQRYGEKGKNGVIIITTKSPFTFSVDDKTIKVERNQNNPWKIGEVEVTSLVYVDDDGSKSSSFYISKITPDSQMDLYKSSLKKENVDVKFSKLKRNSKGEITSIKITLKNDDGQQTSATYEDTEGIGTVIFGTKDKKLFVQSKN